MLKFSMKKFKMSEQTKTALANSGVLITGLVIMILVLGSIIIFTGTIDIGIPAQVSLDGLPPTSIRTSHMDLRIMDPRITDSQRTADEQQMVIFDNQKRENIILYFGASWCPPCQRMKRETWPSSIVQSVIASIPYEYHYIDTDEWPALTERFQVTSIPVTIIGKRVLLNKIEEQGRRVGFIEAEEMEKWLLASVRTKK